MGHSSSHISSSRPVDSYRVKISPESLPVGLSRAYSSAKNNGSCFDRTTAAGLTGLRSANDDVLSPYMTYSCEHGPHHLLMSLISLSIHSAARSNPAVVPVLAISPMVVTYSVIACPFSSSPSASKAFTICGRVLIWLSDRSGTSEGYGASI